MAKLYCVKAKVNGEVHQITNPVRTLKMAKEQANKLKKDMKIAIPKYRWAKDIKIESKC